VDRKERVKRLYEELASRVLVLDGAAGTSFQARELSAEDFGGADLEGCNENLIITRPDVIRDLHNCYLEVGADIVETNTFGGTPLVLAEYDLQDKYYEINLKSAQMARECADEWTVKNPKKPRFVAGSMGPTTKAISVTGGVTFDELIENFYQQGKALYEGGVDYFLLETSQDTRNIKAGLLALEKVNSESECSIPIAVSGTIEPMGTMLAGQTVEALADSLAHVELLYLGLNCATGPEFMTDYMRTLSDLAQTRVACVPNAGLPDEEGRYLETPEMMGRILGQFINNGWVNLLGGCCGTTPSHIAEMVRIANDVNEVRKIPTVSVSSLSGVDYLTIEDEGRPYLVGERTNVIGSRKFKRLITEEKWDEASEIGKAQVKKGAHIVDVCLANPDRDELSDMENFLEKIIQKIKVPIMIDSTDEKVIEKALTYCQGKAIINSINLEDGEERFEAVVPLVKKFGGALVVGTIDEDPVQGMGVSRERKLEIAERSYDLLVNKYGIAPEDIYFDSLVFPCATGDEQYVGSAVETIEGIRLIKEKFPKTKSVLGISNVSFGLPPAGREVLNSVFLYHCVQSGLDLALVNTEKIKRFSSITEEERKLADDLMWNRGEDPVQAFASFFRDKKVEKPKTESLPLFERLPQYIIEGVKDGLYGDLDLALKEMAPMEIINGPLMEGMGTVGKLFNENQLIVAEVLQSAEAMKAAVAHLEPHMTQDEQAQKKGKILLATVKGDVHDIGKNLVDIVLTNNGFEVVNLGIKIPPEQLISAVKEHSPDIIGLSGLLVKSAQQMTITAGDLTQAGVEVPMLVGGAALSKNYVNKKISKAYEGPVVYARDAMNGLELANVITNPEKASDFILNLKNEQAQVEESVTTEVKKEIFPQRRSRIIEELKEAPQAPDYERHVLKNTPIDLIWTYVNPLMLYGRHLGVSGKLVRLLADGNFAELEQTEKGQKAIEIYNEVEAVKDKYRNTHFATKAIYQYFEAQSKDNELIVTALNGEQTSFNFPRQNKEEGLCLSDYISPESGKDNICLFLVTVGEQIREEAEKLKDAGNYLHSHIISALALESAEAYAEYLHSRIRSHWGQTDRSDMTKLEMFQAKYPGKRYSFGYPACPSLDDQGPLFKLIGPSSDIGVELTEGFMMEPEASVSAICFHHPQASYFSVGAGRE